MSAPRASSPGMEAVMHPRRFAGVCSEGRNADLAKLIVGPKEPVIDCRVVDYSGACPEVWAQTRLPDRFEFLVSRSDDVSVSHFDRP
jgi:hypothetical protein